jgi:GntR family transcriptional repressor for pyruvate dehydrogenase complex
MDNAKADRKHVVEPVAVPAAYAVVVETVRRAIHLGQYAPGDKLPPERVFSVQLGVSRVTLREALRVLEGEGYVKISRGATGGVTVRERRASRDELREQLRSGIDDLIAIQEFREANEGLAVERAASRVGDDDLDALARSLDDLRASTSIGEFRQADSGFHLRIAAIADCELLRSAVEDARAAMFLALDALDYDVMLAGTVRAHERILAALRDRDPTKAKRAMSAHIRTTTRELEAILADDASG